MPENPAEESRTITGERYGEWIRAQMVRKGWSQSELTRRTGLKKATVSQIARGTAAQPTAAQIAAFARAFGAAPNDIFRAIGLWEDRDELAIPLSLARTYAELEPPLRVVLEMTGQALEQAQVALGREMSLPTDLAAYDRPDLAAAAREALEQEGGGE